MPDSAQELQTEADYTVSGSNMKQVFFHYFWINFTWMHLQNNKKKTATKKNLAITKFRTEVIKGPK